MKSKNKSEPIETPADSLSGNRKLIHPHLPPNTVPTRPTRRPPSAIDAHRPHHHRPPIHLQSEASRPEPSHAEVFYYQKQIQTQTPMVVMLDDGERLDGVIEWFDRDCIKLRLSNLQRVLVYKSAIKFLYKLGENAGTGLHAVA